MTSPGRGAVAWGTIVLCAGGAAADYEVAVPNNAAVTASLAAGADVHTYKAVIPQGAKVTIAVKISKRGPPLHVTLLDPVGGTSIEGRGTKPSIKAFPVALGGAQSVTVASDDGSTTGGYSFAFTWKTPRPAGRTVVVGPGGQGTFAFSADDGATAVIVVKKAKRSTAVPTLASLDGPNGSTPLGLGSKQSVPLHGAGDYVLTFNGGMDGGGVVVSVAIRPPKTPKTAFKLVGTVPLDAQVVASKTIGRPGGSIGVVAGPLDGASVSVPAGAVSTPVSLLIGAAPNIAGVQPGAAGGPAVFLGPEGLTFKGGLTATVTIPYDPAAFPGGVATVKVYTRDAAGNLTEIVGAVIDPVLHVVSFQTSHFSAFQALRDFHFVETQRIVDAAPVFGDSFGEALAVDGDVAAITAANRTVGGSQGAVTAYHRTGATWTPEQTLSLTDFSNGRFGHSVSVSGSRVLAGAPLHLRTGSGTQTGTAYVFLRDAAGSWTQEAELLPDVATVGAAFGRVVAIDGDTALVAAPLEGTVALDGGAVYVFFRDATGGWTLQQTLRPSTTGGGQLFGTSVAVSGDRAVVGAKGESPNAHGAAYVYRRVGGTWTEAARIAPPDIVDLGVFGTSVAVHGTTVVVSLSPPEPPGSDRPRDGGVRIYEDQGGSSFPETARFTDADVAGPGEPAFGTLLGNSVAVRGDVMLASAPAQLLVLPGAAAPSTSAFGNAHVFHRVAGAWRHVARVRGTPADLVPIVAGDFFGGAIALDANTVFCGVYRSGNPGAGALVFDVSGN